MSRPEAFPSVFRASPSASSVTHPRYRSCTVHTGTPTSACSLPKSSNLSFHSVGISRFAPGTSSAATYASASTVFTSLLLESTSPSTLTVPSACSEYRISLQPYLLWMRPPRLSM